MMATAEGCCVWAENDCAGGSNFLLTRQSTSLLNHTLSWRPRSGDAGVLTAYVIDQTIRISNMRELTVEEVAFVSGGKSVAAQLWDWLTGGGTPTPAGMVEAGGACIGVMGTAIALAPESGGT